ncbi:MAG: heavy-metal-associated domain-containing protein [Bacteroidales bacterium]|nr:heavy-metal-associated domain-containing protein [Bacteroidales bacterium]MCF8327097.1 heavy-metal-associated domain-containing protein [Bacteroidales bacterium]
MQTLQFKTNFKCQGCINATKPYLDQLEGIKNWQVNDKKGYKELVVEVDENVNEEKIVEAVSKAGYTATQKKDGVFGKLFG